MANKGYPPVNKNNSRTNTLMVFLGVIVVLLITIIVLIMKENKGDDASPGKTATDTVSEQAVTSEAATQTNSSAKAPDPGPPDNYNKTTSDRLTPRERGDLPGMYPQVSLRYLTDDDISGKSVWDLRVMRNEVYARYGYIFQRSKDIQDHFNAQPWYVPKYHNVDHMLTNIEWQNVKFLKNNTPTATNRPSDNGGPFE